MKIRNGFVSNSSSSSFILAIKNNIYKECKCYNKVFDIIDNELFTSHDTEIKELKYVIERLKENLKEIDCYDKQYKEELLEKIYKYQKDENYKLVSMDIDYYENYLRKQIEEEKIKGNVIVLHMQNE